MLKAFPNQDDFDSKYCLNPEREFPNPAVLISFQGVIGNYIFFPGLFSLKGSSHSYKPTPSRMVEISFY